MNFLLLCEHSLASREWFWGHFESHQGVVTFLQHLDWKIGLLCSIMGLG